MKITVNLFNNEHHSFSLNVGKISYLYFYTIFSKLLNFTFQRALLKLDSKQSGTECLLFKLC